MARWEQPGLATVQWPAQLEHGAAHVGFVEDGDVQNYTYIPMWVYVRDYRGNKRGNHQTASRIASWNGMST